MGQTNLLAKPLITIALHKIYFRLFWVEPRDGTIHKICSLSGLCEKNWYFSSPNTICYEFRKRSKIKSFKTYPR